MTRHILKKGIVISILCIATGLIGNSVYAEEQAAKPIKLKSKCIKQNPLVAGQTDQTLLGIYQQVCDKDNASRVNDLLAQAAMRMYEIKQPMNALKLATQLQEQNVRGAALTDVAFLASVELANQSLQHMRSSEMRYLSNELTYPPAKQLSDNIRAAVPAPDTSTSKAITDESLKKEVRNTVSNTNTRRTTNRKAPTTQPARNNVTRTAAPKRPAAAAAPATKQPNTVQKTGSNPFDSLK
jgi:hypothetical protein